MYILHDRGFEISVFKMEERQDILARSIGYFDWENDALVRGYLIKNFALAYTIIGSVLELFFFYLYNGPCHPFANILKEPGTPECKLLKAPKNAILLLNN